MRPRSFVNLRRQSFFKRHSRAISILGFLIVLLSFVVKEIFQSKLKDLRDTITEAQDIEKMNGLYDASTLHKVDLDMRLRTIRNQIAGQRIGGTTSRSDIQDEVTDVFQV